ncbi:GIY-YIG nuclease family protein [Hymenobacter nivis]|uniref:GIY-YIG domain-containing protein n=1 Tax=Hymenobacter nivis TaxID=1850093 RepID=A0A502GW00_9BACT|nr:GIY-YIG nuclease family protein [Hymenobacter nivis]TPG66064.1 hypothetical protein EAH73_11890 [Hymenobacter nivis]
MLSLLPKEHINSAGIYRISNTVNSRTYVGSAKKLGARFRSHKSLLLKGKHNSVIMQRFYDKHGAGFLIFDLVELCDEDQLLEREQHYIDSEQPSFNIRKQADRNSGIKRRPETIAKMRAMGKERAKTDAGKAHIALMRATPSSGNTGHKHTDETRAKISANQNRKALSGSNHYLSSISPAQAVEIRAFVPEKLGDMQRLAGRYGVSKSTIERIRSGQRYKL